MDARPMRSAAIELVGTFGLVFFSAAVVCVNQTTTPASQQTGSAPLTLHQPGLFGVAVAQGAILAVLLALTVPVGGGYLNPAIALTQWAFGRLDSQRAGLLIGAQVLGAILAGICLRLIFSADIVAAARYGSAARQPAGVSGVEPIDSVCRQRHRTALDVFPGRGHVRHRRPGRRPAAPGVWRRAWCRPPRCWSPFR